VDSRQRVFESIHIAGDRVTATTYQEPYATLIASSSNDGLDVTGRYSNRHTAQLATKLLDLALKANIASDSTVVLNDR
jgi:hypothetical protein